MAAQGADENDLIEEFKLDNHIDADNFKTKILHMALPLIICNLLAYVSQMFSLNIQQIVYSVDSVTSNIAFIPMTEILCEKLPMAFGYIMSFELIDSRIREETERCQMILQSYIQFSLMMGLLVAILCAAIAPSLSKLISLDSNYHTSMHIYLVFGYLMNSLNAALFYRYLAEERIFLILVRASIQYLGQMCLEEIMYTLIDNRQGNLLTTITFLVINVCEATWQLCIASGVTAYGFKLRNVTQISITELVKFTKESLRFEGRMLLKGFLKFVAEITSPFCIIMAEAFIEQTFTDQTQSFYAENDLYCYAYVYSLTKVVPDAFVSVFALIDALMIHENSFKLEEKANILIIACSIMFSAVIALAVYLLRNILAELYYDMNDTTIKQYFEGGDSNYTMAVLTCLILNCVDIFEQVGVLCAVQSGNYIELVCMPVAKFVVSVLSVTTIKSRIGDRANYLYAIIFSEGCGGIIGIIYIFIDYLHFVIVTKKLDTSISKKEKK